MSDITELFNRVDTADADPDPAVVAADLARGRQALSHDHRRRTIRRSMAATATLAAAVAAILVAGQLQGSNARDHHNAAVGTNHHRVVNRHQTGHHPSPSKPVIHKRAPIKLVSYTGKQPVGFTVDKIPAGWFLGGVSQYALTIDPAGDTDVSAADFEGKLTVLLASKDETSFPSNGTHVTVDGQPGVIWDAGGVQLGYTDSAGHRIVVQVPDQLGWSNDQIIAFAEGVHVTSNALQGVG